MGKVGFNTSKKDQSPVMDQEPDCDCFTCSMISASGDTSGVLMPIKCSLCDREDMVPRYQIEDIPDGGSAVCPECCEKLEHAAVLCEIFRRVFGDGLSTTEIEDSDLRLLN